MWAQGVTEEVTATTQACASMFHLSQAPVHGKGLTVLRVSLHHPTPGPAPFASVPPQLEHDTSPLLVGGGPDTHLRLQLPRLSRQHLPLKPYLEKGGARLAFSLKALSCKGSVWVNRLTLRLLEQMPLGAINRVAFSGIQMVASREASPWRPLSAASISVPLP